MSNPVPLQYGQYYHLYNRGNNRENLFVEERNYRYFLRLYAHHVAPIAETYAYCLLRNHFHFLLRIRDVADLADQRPPSRYVSNFFNAYARAFNKAYERSGALFQRPFGRVRITSDAQLSWLVTYIHHNPQKHRFAVDFRTWPYSSYHAHLSSKTTRPERDEVLAWFQGVSAFRQAHERQVEGRLLPALAPDDFD